MTTALKSAPIISVTASIHRKRLWDIASDLSKFGELLESTSDLEAISRIDGWLTSAEYELEDIANKYAKIAGEK